MTRWLAGLSFLVSGTIWAQAPQQEGDPTDGREVLKRADAAAKAVKVVQYKASAGGIGADATRSPQVDGTAIFGGWVSMGPAKYRFDVKVKKPGSDEVTELVAGSDGNIVYLIDKSRKTVYADIDPAVLGSSGRPARSLLIGKIVSPDGFADELKDDKSIELRGTTRIGDHECYDVLVRYGEDGGEAVWYISKTDFLPRGTERSFPRRDGQKGGRRVTVTDLVVNPQSGDEDPFALTVPEGFTKTDEFAP